MNNRQTSFSNNERIRQKANIPIAQYSPNAASTYNMCPPYRPHEKVNHGPITKNNTPEATRFNSQYNERSERQAFSATVNFPPNQNAIYSPGLTRQSSVPSFQISQNMHGSRHESQMNAGAPNNNRFSKIPCNLDSVQSSDRSDNAYSSSISRVRMQSINHNISPQNIAYRHPPAYQNEMTRSSNSNNFIQQPPVSNMPNFMRPPLQPNSNASTSIRPPQAANAPGFLRPPLSQGFSNPDAVRHAIPQGFSNPDAVSHAIPQGFSNPDAVRHTIPQGLGNPDAVRRTIPQGLGNPDMRHPGCSSNQNSIIQPSVSGYGNPNFIRQPSSFGSSNLDFNKQTSIPVSDNPALRQPSPLDFNKPDFIRQAPPLGPIMGPPPNLPSSNSYMSSGSFGFPSQIPPAHPTGLNPPFASLKQDSNLSLEFGPNLSMPPPSVNQDWLEENKINKFLQRFTCEEKKSAKCDLTVTQFHNRLRDAFVTVRELMELKASLSNLLDANENEWNEKLKEASHCKDKLTKECDFLSEPKVLLSIQERLRNRKIKREFKKKIRANKIEEKAKKLAVREELHQTIDKWLESLKEKNLKLKREAEMKKEADSILAEVRRKIHEAKRTIDKLKVFEKLRSARQANAVKKGLFLPEHDEKFQIRISELKATLFKQLSDYESEEKALKVMLEAEQEGQLEEEALWRIRKLKTAQQRRQRNIMESLFGNKEEPTEEDPIYLFHQFQNSANKSIENLVQIRHQWDLHLSEDGETVPSLWVVPVPPNSAAWEVALES